MVVLVFSTNTNGILVALAAKPLTKKETVRMKVKIGQRNLRSIAIYTVYKIPQKNQWHMIEL